METRSTPYTLSRYILQCIIGYLISDVLIHASRIRAIQLGYNITITTQLAFIDESGWYHGRMPSELICHQARRAYAAGPLPGCSSTALPHAFSKSLLSNPGTVDTPLATRS